MWIKLKGADFSANNIGTLKSYKVDTTGLVGLTVNPKYVSYKTDGETISNVVFTFTVSSGYKFASGSTIKIGSETKYTAGSDLTAGNTFTITMNVNSNIAFVGVAEKVAEPDTPTPEPEEPEDPVNPPSGESNYFDITTQGTIKGSIKDGVINMSDPSSLYYLTKVSLPSNAISVEYQAFKTGGSYGSAFANDAGTVVKFLPRTDITTGARVTEAVPSGATWFYHMWDNPTETTQTADAFTYIRVYTSGESGGGGAEGLPVRITEQTQKNYGLLDAATGTWTAQSYPDEQGGQTVTVCSIPAGATTVNYQMFKTGKTYGSGFFNGSTFISGYANNNDPAGTRKTLSIPAGATEFWHMYPNRAYANGDGECPEFDYIEFA
jgi:hypothetical protein